jgi:hypothetical protein
MPTASAAKATTRKGAKPPPKLRGNRQPLAISLPPDLVQQLDRIAAREYRSRANMIETAIREWLAVRQKAAA